MRANDDAYANGTRNGNGNGNADANDGRNGFACMHKSGANDAWNASRVYGDARTGNARNDAYGHSRAKWSNYNGHVDDASTNAATANASNATN